MRKLILIGLLFTMLQSGAQDTLRLQSADINALFARVRGNTLFENDVFSVSDMVFEKVTRRDGTTTVQVKCSKLNSALFSLTKIGSTYSGRIIKDTALLYNWNDSLHAFIKPANHVLLIQQCFTDNNPEKDAPFFFTSLPDYSPASAHYNDSIDIVVNHKACIFIDFDGADVTGTPWNFNGPITAGASYVNGHPDTLNYIVEWNREAFSFLNVVVTRDSTLFWLAQANRRERVVVTPDAAWYCGSNTCTAGVSYTNSFTWGDGTVSWVFDAIGSPRNIAVGVAHEAGHDFGLNHHSFYIGTAYNNEYDAGYGSTSSEVAWAPIMGAGYYRNMVLWWNGPGPYGWNTVQDDLAIMKGTIQQNTSIANKNGKITKAARLLQPGIRVTEYLGEGNEVDYYKFHSFGIAQTLSALPWGTHYYYGVGTFTSQQPTLWLNLDVYDEQGNSVGTSGNTTTAGAVMSFTLPKGDYYIKVTKHTGETHNTTGYGYIGHYTITVN